jgi:uncharacterized protein
MVVRRQRIRDPLHGLIEFRDEQFEQVLWRAMQTRPFQRLRRVKQLGFSELVYPGASHTRFAHSVGTFHIGRQLMQLITLHNTCHINSSKVNQVLAATLLHDVGHGPFSHAFEDVGERLGWKTVTHESWTARLIRDSEISTVLAALGSGFANDVADVFRHDRLGDMYEAVVSSQFDADRLDYMQRDRLMTGTQHGAIDFAWLLTNIEVGRVRMGVDDADYVQDVETFVLGSKAVSAAETYVLGLLQLYQTVYLHKATRGVEKLFTELLVRVCQSVQSGDASKTSLPDIHPIVQFAQNPESMEVYLSLDDTVIWGAVPLLVAAPDPAIAELATRLRDRKLYQCIDILHLIERGSERKASGVPAPASCCARIFKRLKAWKDDNPGSSHHLLLDKTSRAPYKRFDESKGPLNQIRIRSACGGDLVDIATRSAVVNAIPKIEIWRAYVPRDNRKLQKLVEDTVRETQNGQPD